MISNSHTHRAQQAASVQQTASVRQAASAFLPEFIRAAALILAALTLCAFLAVRPAQAAEWMQPYLEQVQEWGVMRGDGKGNLNEDRTITRAEFVTLVNRAFGYTEAGENPFTDVNPNDWYAEDISIAHQAGYFNGTSANTASPLAPVTREQAAVLLGRCLRLQGETGVYASTFDDIEAVGGWSRGLIQEAADMGIIQGYADGTFRPSEPITRGQMACFLVRALGTLIQEPGDQSSGGVYGNLTINVPGVKLKDTTITGNLYLTGGVGLGNLELENVTVLGKIIVCGSGEAEHGEHSIILRNVTAGGLEVDSLMDQFLSIRAEGLTAIDNTIVRTSAYLEDLTEDGLGLKLIRLDGAEGTRLQLAGNIKEVLNLTPSSTLQLAQGVAGVVTMDEKAVGASLTIDVDSVIKELNLDTATPVTGAGSITRLNVSAAGSNVSMLPDTIYVRPGINSTIANQTMDNKAANESSDEPRILAGYPAAKNIAPTSAEAVFRTNKAGTIRWALTALMDGSLGQEDLLNPGSNARILQSGTISATASNTDFTARLSGLTKEGSYYISALLEDARGHRSAVKVAAFTTPDDSVPAFATGYPETPECTVDQRTGEQVAQVKVMATKSCQLYYVLLPKNSTAPTAADFRAAAIPGSLGSGVISLQKNTPFLISRINTSHLAEKTEYDLYLWLNDADNGKSSAVRKITFTTKDITPPSILSLYDKSFTGTSVTMTFSLNEPGSIYWVVVKKDANFYASGIDKNNPGEAAKIQIMRGSGSSVISRGGPIQAAQGGTEYNFTVSGLSPQSYYDLYYVALDTAENYCVYSTPLIPPMEIHTEDTQNPSVTQDPPSGSSVSAKSPITFTFDEVVYPTTDSTGQVREDPDFLGAYNAAKSGGAEAQRAFAELLMRHIVLYIENDDHSEQTAEEAGLVRNASNASTIGDNWVIDYRYATVTVNSDGTMVIFFPHGTAINLGSSITYHFVFRNVADGAGRMLEGTDSNGEYDGLPSFTTTEAQLILSAGSATGTVGGETTMFDLNFRITPDGTAKVSNEKLWDMIFWASETLEFELYCNDGSGWEDLGKVSILTNAQQPRTGVSYTGQVLGTTTSGVYNFEQLNQVSGPRDYGIIITKRGDSENRGTWSGTVEITILPVAGDLSSLSSLADYNQSLTPAEYAQFQRGNYAVQEIGVYGTAKDYTPSKTFTDTAPPTFVDGYPLFEPTDSGVTIRIRTDRDNSRYFCIVAKVGDMPTTVDNIGSITKENGLWSRLPASGSELDTPTAPGNATIPSTSSITSGNTYKDPTIYKIRNGSCGQEVTPVNISATDPDGGLEASTEYIAYIVLQGTSPASASKVYAFKFQTEAVTRPQLTVTLRSPWGIIQSNREADVWYALVTAGTTEAPFNLTLKDFCTVGVNGWTSSNSNADISVLEAMRLSADNNSNASLFDTYADLSNSNTIQIVNIVKSSGSSGGAIPVSGGPITLNSRNDLLTEIDFTKYLVNNAEYWLVAIGQCQGTSGHAFRSNRYLRNVDNTPPQVNSLDTSRTSGTIYTIDDYDQALMEEYSGVITISFTEPLYYRVSSEVRRQIIDAEFTVSADNQYMSSDMLLGSVTDNTQFKIDHRATFDPNNPQDCMRLYIKYTNCTEGTTLTFDANLCDSQNNPGAVPLALTLHLVERTTGTGTNQKTTLVPTFEFSNSRVQSVWESKLS